VLPRFHTRPINVVVYDGSIGRTSFVKRFKKIFTLKPDLVLHLAVDTHVDVSLTKPLSHYNNTKATLYFLSILRLTLQQKDFKKKLYLG